MTSHQNYTRILYSANAPCDFKFHLCLFLWLLKIIIKIYPEFHLLKKKHLMFINDFLQEFKRRNSLHLHQKSIKQQLPPVILLMLDIRPGRLQSEFVLLCILPPQSVNE